MGKEAVMLVLEGTYPYNGGGVSTWAHLLCSKVQNVNFKLYSINANFENKPKYDLSPNITEVIQVPLWTPDEPYDYISYGDEYYKTVGKKEWTTTAVVEKNFVPLFSKLLNLIYDENVDVKDLDEVFRALWLYFEDYDYKETMRSEPVWKAYREAISKNIVRDYSPDAALIDITIGLRWIYRFLIPLAITDVPKCAIAHLTLSGFPVIPALIAHYKYGTKIMLTEHGVFIRERLLALNNSEYPFFLKRLLIQFSEAIAKLAYYKSDAIVSVNQFNIKWEKMYGADPKKISIIYNGIDSEKFKPKPKPQHLQKIPTVVAAARIFELKDVLTMIRSCAVVKKEIPEILYLVYGDDKAVPEYTQTCLELIEELGVEENFRFMGPRNDSHEIFPEGDLSILTSISEGFPYTVIESMSCGVPVVSTDVGGVKEALDENSGYLCKPKNAEEIGLRIIELLQDNEKRLNMANHARQRVLDNFTISKFIQQYEDIYESLLQENIVESKYMEVE
ncbi:GT4 family glycosyltransferase PelF [Gillisia sp. Hel_I_29]|uniref:GT4 family glycosyltransferase PelF n=1 Tax=Gillisia sp. Hel_I_29 TaxID=1249975 RepID=UPI00055562C4|nr:GT4 family glycosyltransferase PelF [Gillisia sp. Hel_I_29]